ncbi:hypothetical protein R3P38DRAFT_2758959 [Favolaschia claudopus]|uniref:Uncharacterized protein n=1 Tax=Favolaschia claudopus TaxID=2862362 RepID=A0AAW0E2C0_9AGAR
MSNRVFASRASRPTGTRSSSTRPAVLADRGVVRGAHHHSGQRNVPISESSDSDQAMAEGNPVLPTTPISDTSRIHSADDPVQLEELPSALLVQAKHHPLWYIRAAMYLVGILHTRHHVTFSACDLILRVFKFVFENAPSDSFRGASTMPKTLITVLSALDMTDKFVVHPICYNCHRMFDPNLGSDGFCSACEIPLFDTVASVPVANSLPLGDTAVRPVPAAKPIRVSPFDRILQASWNVPSNECMEDALGRAGGDAMHAGWGSLEVDQGARWRVIFPWALGREGDSSWGNSEFRLLQNIMKATADASESSIDSTEHILMKILLGVGEDESEAQALGTIQDAATYGFAVLILEKNLLEGANSGRVTEGIIARRAEVLEDDYLKLGLIRYYHDQGHRAITFDTLGGYLQTYNYVLLDGRRITSTQRNRGRNFGSCLIYSEFNEEGFAGELQIIFKHSQDGVSSSSQTLFGFVRWMKRSMMTPLTSNQFIWDDLRLSSPELGIET